MESPRVGDRDRHAMIVFRIEELLEDRSWRWLANESGVPQSTLATQKLRWFTEPVLARIAEALGVSVGVLFPDHLPPVNDRGS